MQVTKTLQSVLFGAFKGVFYACFVINFLNEGKVIIRGEIKV